jgi:hypothetical protein
MTYTLNGRQYIVVAIAGPGFPGELIAFRVPDEERKNCVRPAQGSAFFAINRSLEEYAQNGALREAVPGRFGGARRALCAYAV